MSENEGLLRRVPALAENRVRYILLFIGITLSILLYLAKVPIKAPPLSRSLFERTSSSAGSLVRGEKRDGQAETHAEGERRELSLDELSFDDLAKSSGFSEELLTPSDSSIEGDELPSSFRKLLKLLGDYRRQGEVAKLSSIVDNSDNPSRARILALGELRHFDGNTQVGDTLISLIEDSQEPFYIRESALSSLLHIDGRAFAKFFEELCLKQLRSEHEDRRVSELLKLAAYGDVVLYGGRSLNKLLPKLQSLAQQSELAATLASFRLRLDETELGPVEITRYKSSKDLTVLSNFLAYLKKRSLYDPDARSLLEDFASQHSKARIRKLAKGALGRVTPSHRSDPSSLLDQ